MLSIITVNKNNAAGLKKTIESIRMQSSKAFEFIVIDGNSNDESKEIMATYSDCITIAISETDSGIYNAMNKGIKQATGDYLLFLNSGDYLLNDNTIETVSPHLNTYDVICGDIVIEDEKGIQHQCISEDEISLDSFFYKSVYHQATFIAKKMFDTYGLYDESFKIGGDYEFFIRLFYKYNISYHHIWYFITYFKSDGISNSPKHLDLNQSEAKKSWELNVSQRTLKIFEQDQKTKNSEVYWIYQKYQSSKLFRKIIHFINLFRNKIYSRFR
jgi:glycosyltransferase involved in cell wall biosynthesis